MLIGHSVSDATGHLLAMDPAVCEIMQRNARELLGMSYTELTHPDDRVFNIDLVDRLGINDGPTTIRKRYIRPDGTAVWADVQVSRLVAADVHRLIGTIRLVHPDGIARGPESLWRSARRVHALIQQRRMELGDDMFSDHGWIVLLQIYLAEAEGRVVDGAAIGEISAIRPAIVTRWIQALAAKGLVEHFNRDDRPTQLTALGIAKVERVLDYNIGSD